MCFSQKSPSMPPTPPPVASVTEISDDKGTAAQYSRTKERQRLAALAGRQSTILTGGLGDASAANVQKKTLLG